MKHNLRDSKKFLPLNKNVIEFIWRKLRLMIVLNNNNQEESLTNQGTFLVILCFFTKYDCFYKRIVKYLDRLHKSLRSAL